MSDEIIKLYEYFINRPEIRDLFYVYAGLAIVFGIVFVSMFVFILKNILSTQRRIKSNRNRFNRRF